MMKEPDVKLARAIHRRTVFKNLVLKEIFTARNDRKKKNILDIVSWWKKHTRGLDPREMKAKTEALRGKIALMHGLGGIMSKKHTELQSELNRLT